MKKLTLIIAIVSLTNLLFAQIINRRDIFPSNQQGINLANNFQLTEQAKQSSSCPYLDSVIQAKMEIGHLPGVSACIIKGGQVRWVGVYGDANIEMNIPVDTATLFMLASVSKTVTVTALMQLWEEGLFELDDNINDYLSFEILNPFHPEEPITFKMLCTHTSSIRDNWSLMPYYWNGDSPIPLDEYLFDYLNPDGANYISYLNYYDEIPGTNLHYSNIGVALMGYLVEVIGDSTFSYQTQERIFEPLQMNETAWFVSELDTMHIAMPYFWNGNAYTAYGHYGYSSYPCGQLRTSIDQLTNFLLCYHNGGTYLGQQILQSSTVEMILTPQIPQINPDIGLIWKKYTLGAREILGHYGGDDGVMSCMHFCLEENSAVIIFANREDAIGYQIQELLFDYAADSIEIQCLPEGIAFSTQEEIDNFQINYPGCNMIEGDVTICGENITNLNGLSALTSLGGDLSIGVVAGIFGFYIGNPSLANLSALQNLDYVGGSLIIAENDSLTNLQGLENITTIEGDLKIIGNDNIISLSGLDNLSSIEGDFYLGVMSGGFEPMPLGNPSLASLSALENLTTIGNGIRIVGNGSLVNLSGLDNLTSIGGSLLVKSNYGLINLDGLNNLASISDDIIVYDNCALTSLSGLDNIGFVDGNIIINYNIELVNLEAFLNIDGINGDFAIRNNSLLIDLAGVENITSIAGDLNIEHNNNLSSLAGLENIVSIDSNLIISNNNSLVDLSVLTGLTTVGGIIITYNYFLNNIFALENIISVDGDIQIIGNNSLAGLNGLHNISSIGGNLKIGNWNSGNSSLTNLSGLGSLVSVDGDLIVGNNETMVHLSGIDNLVSVGGDITIRENESLINLTGINNLSTVGGDVTIFNHYDLLSISGLENLTTIEGNLEIHNNSDLTNLTGLNSLHSIGGDFALISNVSSLTGLENLSTIGGNLGLYYSWLQADLSGLGNLQSIGGSLIIQNNNSLTGLTGLDLLESVSDSLIISGNEILQSITGLEVISSLGGSLVISENDILTDLSGLDSLESVGLDLRIKYNYDLVSVTALYNLNSIGSDMEIAHNYFLTSLAGLDNVVPGTIDHLSIYYNSSLSACAVESICTYLFNPNGGSINIHDNASGCSNPQEVEDACAIISKVNKNEISEFIIYPSPVADYATLTFGTIQSGSIVVEILNSTGIHVRNWQFSGNSTGQYSFILDFTALPDGMYLCRMNFDNEIQTKKILKVR